MGFSGLLQSSMNFPVQLHCSIYTYVIICVCIYNNIYTHICVYTCTYIYIIYTCAYMNGMTCVSVFYISPYVFSMNSSIGIQ